MDEYAELMARYEMMMADWMRRVEANRKGPLAPFYAEGVVLGKRGTLRLAAKDARRGATLWELSSSPGDTQVRITFPSGDTYLV